jgi:hypothetical protein
MWGSALRCGGPSARPVQAAWEVAAGRGPGPRACPTGSRKYVAVHMNPRTKVVILAAGTVNML